MATTKLYLDTRAVSDGEPAPLKIALTKHGKTALYPLGVRLLPSQWDNKRQVILNHPNKLRLNNFIRNRKTEFDNHLMQLTDAGELAKMTATDIKNLISGIIDPDPERADLFLSRYRLFASTRKAVRTREIYQSTIDKILHYDAKASRLSFDDITKSWLDGFETFMADTEHLAPNTIAIHLRNIRAVVNDAIDNDITTNYPFRKKYHIKQKKPRKRALPVQKLRELFDYKVEPFMQKYIDTFKLTFFLIGINPVDLCGDLKLEEGRIIYDRSKTGRLYNIKLEPEAAELLDKYKGKAHLFGLAEKTRNYHSFVTNLDKYLKQIGPVELIPNPNKHRSPKAKKFLKVRTSAFPGISIYWARHTWATIAASLDIPKETISAALGHGYGNQTTSIYIDFDMKKVDDANRRVIDYVLWKGEYGKG